MKTAALLIILLVTSSRAACTVYGDGGIHPTAVLPGNDKHELVGSYLGIRVREIVRYEDGPYECLIQVGGVWAASKAANSFALFELVVGACHNFVQCSKHDLSHVTFYAPVDAPASIPEPSRLAMVVSAALVLFGRRRRSRRTVKYNAQTH